MLQDLAFGFRSLWRQPGFTITVVLALAAGIGANSAMFSFIDGVLLKPLPFAQPERLVNLWEVIPKRNIPRLPAPVGNYLDWRTMNHVLADMGAFSPAAFSLASATEPERYLGAKCDEGLFSTLRVTAVKGRGFTAEDNLPGRDTVAVIGYGLWKQRFGGDAHIVGQKITLDGRPREIVGVMPQGFTYPGQSVVWVPYGWAEELRTHRDFHDIRVIGRLKDGVSLEQAQTEFSSIAADLDRQYPILNEGELITVNSALEDLVGQIRPALAVLLGAVGFVLLIACANVANLLLARAAGRARELAICASLGASRARILRQLLAESLLLSTLGGLAGLLIGYGAIQTILAVAPATVPRLAEVHLDWRAIGFTLILSVLTGIVFGIFPAWSASRADVHSVLKEGSRGTTGHGRARSALVVAQVIAAVVLLAGAGLLVRSFYALIHVDAGFDAGHVETMRLVPAPLKYNGHPELQRWAGRANAGSDVRCILASAGRFSLVYSSDHGGGEDGRRSCGDGRGHEECNSERGSIAAGVCDTNHGRGNWEVSFAAEICVGADRGFRRARIVSGGSGLVRRDLLLGGTADAGDRHPDGAGCKTEPGSVDDRAARTAAGCDGTGCGRLRCAGADAFFAWNAVWRQPRRPDYVPGRWGDAGVRGSGGLLLSGEPGGAGASDDCAAARLMVDLRCGAARSERSNELLVTVPSATFDVRGTRQAIQPYRAGPAKG